MHNHLGLERAGGSSTEDAPEFDEFKEDEEKIGSTTRNSLETFCELQSKPILCSTSNTLIKTDSCVASSSSSLHLSNVNKKKREEMAENSPYKPHNSRSQRTFLSSSLSSPISLNFSNLSFSTPSSPVTSPHSTSPSHSTPTSPTHCHAQRSLSHTFSYCDIPVDKRQKVEEIDEPTLTLLSLVPTSSPWNPCYSVAQSTPLGDGDGDSEQFQLYNSSVPFVTSSPVPPPLPYSSTALTPSPAYRPLSRSNQRHRSLLDLSNTNHLSSTNHNSFRSTLPNSQLVSEFNFHDNNNNNNNNNRNKADNENNNGFCRLAPSSRSFIVKNSKEMEVLCTKAPLLPPQKPSLPLITASDRCQRISPETLADLLSRSHSLSPSNDHDINNVNNINNNFESIGGSLHVIDNSDEKFNFSKVLIIDARYDYEYEGGHIVGAVHCPPNQIESFLENSILTHFLEEKMAIIFHCEFSSKRAPSAYQILRSLDRLRNLPNYPNLTFPDTYVLHGGYKDFFNLFPHRCSPSQYVEMKDKRYKHLLRDYTAEKKLKRSRACSLFYY